LIASSSGSNAQTQTRAANPELNRPELAPPSTPARFTRLEPLAPPKVLSSAPAYPGGRHEATNLVDRQVSTAYSSDNLCTNTFLEFDFGAPTKVAAFRHQDRNDPATIAASTLTFKDSAGAVVGQFNVRHVNERGGVTFFTLPAPVAAQRARWQV